MNIKTSSGFSLLEIVVAMLILSLIVAGTFGLFVTSHKFISEAGHRLQAIEYARMVAENLKIYVTADMGTNLSSGTPPGAGNVWSGTNPTAAPLNFPSFGNIIPGATCNYSVSNNIPGPNMKQVAINVNWTEQ